MSESQEPENTTKRLPVLEKDAGPGSDAAPRGHGLDQSASAAAYDPPPVLDGDGGDQRRFWSARRVPAALTALILLGLAGLFLYDIAAVRAGHSAMSWRRELATQLAERPLDDTWVLTGAGVAAALGLWLVVLALTPGLRTVLPMRRVHPDVRAGLRRDAAALALRDRAMEVSGVQSVRVRMRRRRADVRAVSHFRPLDDVRTDLDTVLGDAVRGLGLSRPPALAVHVRRPGRKG
ncbi:DUF6286 domain-containing protein [Streptomyces sp. NPDC048290]|uniref:DUF6286 domain-containing protein n=1 Tax=Streptomyces sp. NPDC048290 TaxID=3155811 RepID=UPI00341741F8